MVSGLIVMVIGFGLAYYEFTSHGVTNMVDVDPMIVYALGAIIGLIGLMRVFQNVKWFSKGY